MSHQSLQSLKALEQIKDSRSEFIENLLAAFERDHPDFIEHLKECGLDEEEIRFCCLYVIGLKGKDIKTYTNQSRLYIQSAEIRHKLGLTENDTNLSIHLRNMCENEVC